MVVGEQLVRCGRCGPPHRFELVEQPVGPADRRRRRRARAARGRGAAWSRAPPPRARRRASAPRRSSSGSAAASADTMCSPSSVRRTMSRRVASARAWNTRSACSSVSYLQPFGCRLHRDRLRRARPGTAQAAEQVLEMRPTCRHTLAGRGSPADGCLLVTARADRSKRPAVTSTCPLVAGHGPCREGR